MELKVKTEIGKASFPFATNLHSYMYARGGASAEQEIVHRSTKAVNYFVFVLEEGVIPVCYV